MDDGTAHHLEVVRLGHPVLRSVAEPVPEDLFGSRQLRQLGRDLIRTMLVEEGVGLAAPQVAEPLRLFAYWLPASNGDEEVEPRLLVNPELKAIGDESVEGWEGCLSIPGLRGLVARSQRIKVKGRNIDGEPVSITADGLHARVLQHENDHLDGIVFLDRMRSPHSLAYEQEWERYVLGGGDDD